MALLSTPEGYATPQQIAAAEAIGSTSGGLKADQMNDVVRALLGRAARKAEFSQPDVSALEPGPDQTDTPGMRGANVAALGPTGGAVAGGSRADQMNDVVRTLLKREATKKAEFSQPDVSALEPGPDQIDIPGMRGANIAAPGPAGGAVSGAGGSAGLPGPRTAQATEPMVPGGPAMDNDARRAVGLVSGQPNNVDAGVTAFIARMTRLGVPMSEIGQFLQQRQVYMPQIDTDPYGNVIERRIGQAPIYRGHMPGHPGKPVEMDIGGIKIPAYEHVDPRTGEVTRTIPNFGAASGAGAQNTGAPGAPAAPNAGIPGAPTTPNAGGGGLSNVKSMDDLIRYGQGVKAQGEALTEGSKLEMKRNVDNFNNINKMASDAKDEIPQLELLKRVIGNPMFYSGLMSGQVNQLDMLGHALGVTSGQVAQLSQLAQKLGSAGSLELIKEMGAQGAVRVPEMTMVQKSNFDPENTRESNAAVVELRLRAAKRGVEWANQAKKYADAHGGFLDRGFEQQLRDWTEANPMITNKELADYGPLLTPREPKAGETGRTYQAGETLKGVTGPDGQVHDMVARPDGWYDANTNKLIVPHAKPLSQ
jgi:hypothetical protein